MQGMEHKQGGRSRWGPEEAQTLGGQGGGAGLAPGATASAFSFSLLKLVSEFNS